MATTPAPAMPPPAGYPDEPSLYPDFTFTIRESFTKDEQIESFTCDITASQGRRATGGKWTRPDVTLVAVRTFRFVPGKSLEVITFEVKPADAFDVDGVFETASHSVFAHRAYLAIHKPAGLNVDPNLLERLESECKRFGVGLIYFENPKDWDSFEIKVEADISQPDPAKVNDFITTQIPTASQTKLDQYIR